MSQVVDYIRGLIQECESHQIRATMDPRNINPPCVLFTPPRLELDSLHGAQADFAALVLVPGPGNSDALIRLDELTQDVCRNVLKMADRISPVEYTPDNGPAYPAYQVEWNASLDWPDPCNTP